MGAVFTIALFFPLMVPIYLLDKLGIDLTGFFESFLTAVITWVKTNPEKAIKIGDALESIMEFIVEIVDKLNVFQI